ncbi:MAG: ABC transporter ATP-binding protein [Gemmatales bacterium]
MSTPLLETVALTKDYGRFRALDQLNLTIAPGEVFGLLGPNGSGKSTAIRILLGMLRPSAGKAQVNGHDCWSQSVEVRKLVSYLPGELRLYDNLTGIQLLSFLAGLRSQPLSGDIQKLSTRFNIDIKRPLSQLSSGMKRKIALMAVILARTPLAILDEPTNTLDPTMRDELLDQILEARDRGQTILFSSHVLQEVETVCHRVGILRLGKLVHLQSLDEIRSQRRIHVQFKEEPKQALPSDVAAERSALSWKLHIRGELQPALNWLAQNQVTDLRIEPEGLTSIYQKYHSVESEVAQ